jgi:hypothetical protein
VTARARPVATPGMAEPGEPAYGTTCTGFPSETNGDGTRAAPFPMTAPVRHRVASEDLDQAADSRRPREE